MYTRYFSLDAWINVFTVLWPPFIIAPVIVHYLYEVFWQIRISYHGWSSSLHPVDNHCLRCTGVARARAWKSRTYDEQSSKLFSRISRDRIQY